MTFFSRSFDRTTGTSRASAAAPSRPVQPLTLEATDPRMARSRQFAMPCINQQFLLDERPAYAVVGEINNAYKRAFATFTYGQRADSEFSVGVQKGGGDFALEGSTTVTNSLEAAEGIRKHGPYARRYLTKFRFRKYDFHACAPYGPRSTMIKAHEWVGGQSLRKQPTKAIRVCKRGERWESGGFFARKSYEATVWRLGARVFGVGLTSRSGFSKWAQLRFNFYGPANSRYLTCGSNATTLKAKRVFSGKYRGRS